MDPVLDPVLDPRVDIRALVYARAFFLSWSPGGFFYSLARGSARGYPRAMLAVLSPSMI